MIKGEGGKRTKRKNRKHEKWMEASEESKVSIRQNGVDEEYKQERRER